MSSNICPICKKTFGRKDGLKRHIVNNACKIYTHFCKTCSKGFTTETSMYRHMRKACKIKKHEDTDKNEICENIDRMKIMFEEKIKEMEEKIKEMEEKMKKMEKSNKQLVNELKEIKHSTKINGNNNNNVNNGTVNNTTNNIVIVGHGKEDMSKIDYNDMLKILTKGYDSTIHLTEAVHFNPKYPEFQNIYISNIKDKYALMYDGEKWILITKEDLIDKIYNNKKNYIEDNLEKYVESLPKIYVNSLNRWLNTDETDPRITKIKNDIKILLYNSRKLPMNTDNQIQNKIKQSIKKISDKPNIKKVIVDDTCDSVCSDESNESDNSNESIVFAKSKPYIKKK